MKEFSSVTAMIKNSDGIYEGIPALRGVDSYELAVKNGYKGTEEEWLESIIGDGWIGAYQELKTQVDDIEEKSASKTYVQTYQKPWNVDENVGRITASSIEELKIDCGLYTGYDVNSSKSIVMINSGKIYLDFIYYSVADFFKDKQIDLYINDVLTQTYTADDLVVPSDTQQKDFRIELDVTKGDIITINASGSTEQGTEAVFILKDIHLKANIETAYTYLSLEEDLEESSIEDVVNTLLGVTE